MQNIIVLWSGAIVDIPAGWALCDGNNGTPDLRDCFVIGAGSIFAPDATAPSTVQAGVNLAYYALAYIMKVP
ncbi:hypothetical protein ES703_86927 [subsurface metagenome]